jgi:cellulose synthase/poly-beta-1,6-N-acetylglucosamine synthase-like glycosyltransferase
MADKSAEGGPVYNSVPNDEDSVATESRGLLAPYSHPSGGSPTVNFSSDANVDGGDDTLEARMRRARSLEQRSSFFAQNGREVTSVPNRKRPPKMRPVFRSTFADEMPETPGRKYFHRLAREEAQSRLNAATSELEHTIGICIPCYNEPVAGLINTLGSLVALEIPDGFKLNVIILMDGAKHIYRDEDDLAGPGHLKESIPHESTRSFLSNFYGVDWSEFEFCEPCEHCRGLHGSNAGSPAGHNIVLCDYCSDGMKWSPKTADGVLQTTIYESLQWYKSAESRGEQRTKAPLGSVFSPMTEPDLGGDVEGGGQAAGNRFRVSCLIKKKNLKKHNSHQWFMSAFAEELKCKYIFCTDCSTVFDSQMLVKLTSHLEANPGTTAVCGRQRVMSVYLQNKGTKKPQSGECLNARAEFMLRQVQTFDFEADHPVSKASFDFLGWLPVLPGPCGMYRFKDLRDVGNGEKSRRDSYFELVNKPADKCGLIEANLKIAEDRIPSLYAVFPKLEPGQVLGAFKTHWVHDAVFYFEAETNLKALVTQRRRWLNGTNAGYLHILCNVKSYIWDSEHSSLMKFCTTIMLLMQHFQIIVLSFGPSIFASIFFAILYYLFTPACPLDDLFHREARVRKQCMTGLAIGQPFMADTPFSPDDCSVECAHALATYLQCTYTARAESSVFTKAHEAVLGHALPKSDFFQNVSDSELRNSCSELMMEDANVNNLAPLGQMADRITTYEQKVIAYTGMGLYLMFYLVFLWVHRVRFEKKQMISRAGVVTSKKTSMFPSTEDEAGKGWEKQNGSEYKPWAWKTAIVINVVVVAAFIWTLYVQRSVVHAHLEQIFSPAEGRRLPEITQYERIEGYGINCYDKSNPFYQLHVRDTLKGSPYGCSPCEIGTTCANGQTCSDQNQDCGVCPTASFDWEWTNMHPIAEVSITQALSYAYDVQPEPEPEPEPEPPPEPLHGSAVVDQINSRFVEGTAAPDVAAAGVVIHQFGGSMHRDPEKWLPCSKPEWCDRRGSADVSNVISSSIISKMSPEAICTDKQCVKWTSERQFGIFGHEKGGFVFKPELIQVLCSYPGDGNTAHRVCLDANGDPDPKYHGKPCVGGCVCLSKPDPEHDPPIGVEPGAPLDCDNSCPTPNHTPPEQHHQCMWSKDQLADMLKCQEMPRNASDRCEGAGSTYNELVVDAKTMVDHLPK